MSKALKAAIEANDPAATAKAAKTVKDFSRKLPKADEPLAYACQLGADAVINVLLDGWDMDTLEEVTIAPVVKHVTLKS